MLKKLYCTKDIYEYKKGNVYQYREENAFSIYIYYHTVDFRIGKKFAAVVPSPNHNYYKLYFCTLSEMRKLKLKKLEKLK
jgi:hypothetical protein